MRLIFCIKKNFIFQLKGDAYLGHGPKTFVLIWQICVLGKILRISNKLSQHFAGSLYLYF